MDSIITSLENKLFKITGITNLQVCKNSTVKKRFIIDKPKKSKTKFNDF